MTTGDDGKPAVDDEAKGTDHTQLGKKTSKKRGKEYSTRRTVDKDGKTRKQTDYTDHDRDDHVNPHDHNYNKDKQGNYKREPGPGKSSDPNKRHK